MDEQGAIALDLAAVLAVEVDGMGVESERAKAKEQGRRRGEAEAVCWLVGGRWREGKLSS